MKLSTRNTGPLRITFAICMALLLSQCVATSFDSARMLNKGDVELTGSYAAGIAAADGESQYVTSNIGVRAGIGISDKFNIKLIYARLIPRESHGEGVNYFAIAPKIAILEDYISTSICKFQLKSEPLFG